LSSEPGAEKTGEAKGRWAARAQALQRDVYALYLAARDRRTPWYAKMVAVLVTAYALSPIDLIPDAIPVLGYLDDLVLLPLGVLLARRLIPPPVMAESRERAAVWSQGGLKDRRGVLVVIGMYAVALAIVVVVVTNLVSE